MSYSLISRDVMAAMVGIQALGHPHDGMVLISGNDKTVPAHLLAIGRCDIPAIHPPGGTQLLTVTGKTLGANLDVRRWQSPAAASQCAIGLRSRRTVRRRDSLRPAPGGHEFRAANAHGGLTDPS
jgi:Dehydratase family